jgi:hypothetical protein
VIAAWKGSKSNNNYIKFFSALPMGMVGEPCLLIPVSTNTPIKRQHESIRAIKGNPFSFSASDGVFEINNLNNQIEGGTDETTRNYLLRSHIGDHHRLLQALYRYNEKKPKIQID